MEGEKVRNMVLPLTALVQREKKREKKQESILHALYSCQITRIPAPLRDVCVANDVPAHSKVGLGLSCRLMVLTKKWRWEPSFQS